MPVSTKYFADSTNSGSFYSVIDDALRSLHIAGTLLLRETYAPPWAITIPDAASLADLLKLGDDVRAVAFHLVEFGHCTVRPETGDEMSLQAGEMAICFGGGAHRLGLGRAAKAQAVETLLAGGANIQRPRADATGSALLCGVFLLRHTAFNPLFDALPPLLHSSLSRRGELHNLSGVARLLAEETDRNTAGGGYIVERLLEVLCAEAIRAHIETVPSRETGWFRGIRDPLVGRAIAAMHAHPGEDWSVPRLARQVSMSPSRFAARFSEAVGASPIVYLAKWRMNVACRQLSATRHSVDRVAADVGYQSPAAFSRAFHKHLGVSPANWRKNHGLANGPEQDGANR
jgi:AraC-like DNA-binding protein